MSFAFDAETVIGIIIIAFFSYVLWRGGSANPVGTGQIQRQVNTIGAEVLTMKKSLEACAAASDIERLSVEMAEMRKQLASSGEVVALEGQITAVNMRISGMERLVERTDAGVARIEGYFLEKGIKG